MPTSRPRRQPAFPPWLRWARRLLAPLAAAALGCLASASPLHAPDFLTTREQEQGFRDGRVIAKPRAAMNPVIDQMERGEGLRIRASYPRFGGVRVLGLVPGDSVMDAVRRLRATGRYEYVEPDFIRHATTTPNDLKFPSQWALNNTGANGGIAGADLHAVAAWTTISAAPSVIVGILDSGALLTHQDLAANLWVNTAAGTTVSYPSINDNTGSADTISETDSANGLNAVAHSGPPADDVGHGTHVSGIVGAVGNNSVGVAGIAWTVLLMELKFLDSSGNGTTSDELPCIEYAIAHHVNVINASFGSTGASQAEMDAIQKAGQAGIIFVCAAGNSAENIDISPFFPADYPLDNIICVGATDNRDLPAFFSNYGSGSVEIYAPGEDILSTYYSNSSSYQYLSGTSMASPMVAGSVALLRAKYPSDSYRETINRVLNSADRNAALAGKSQSGGRLSLSTAVTTAQNSPPNALFANRTVLEGLDPYTRSNNADSPAPLESGTPQIAGIAGGHSLWWEWTAPEDASVEIDTSGTNGGQFLTGGSTYATLLGVYTGSLGGFSAVASNSNFGTESLEGGGGTVSYSEVKFHATAGTTYEINVQGQGSASGQTILAINTNPDYDSFSTPRVLSGPSVSVLDANQFATLQTGEPSILGNAGGHSLWYQWTAPKSGPFQVSGYSYDFDPEVGVYTGTSVRGLTTVASAAGTGDKGTVTDIFGCVCSFYATAGTVYMIKADGVTANDIGEFTLSIVDSRWQAVTGDAVTCSPAVGPDGTVYVGSNDDSFYAFNPDGTVKWSHASGSLFDTSSAAIAPDGTVYAGSTDGKVYAFNPDGSSKWTFPVPGASPSPGLSSSPALAADGTLYIHADDGNLYALTPAGAQKWAFQTGGVSYAAPTIASDGTVYVGTDGGLVYAINPGGTQKWLYTAPVSGESVYTAPAIDSAGNLYFGTLSGNVYSLHSDGTLRWAHSIGDGVTSAPAISGGNLYFGGYDGRLYALSAASGSQVWSYTLGAQVRASAPAVDAGGNVYIGCYDHNIYEVSPGGSLVRIFASDDWIRSSPVIAGTTLYFGSNDHKVYAIDLATSAADSDWPMYQFNARRLGRASADTFAITAQPATQTVATGGELTLYVGATGAAPLSYQWSLNGAAIAGAVNSTYFAPSASSANAGSYTVSISNGSSSLTSAPATVTVGAAPTPTPTPTPATGGGGGGSSGASPGRIVNLSARAGVGTGGNILIAGFVIQGTGSKNVVLRGIGPTLGLAPYNVTGVLAQPQLTLVSSATNATVATATVWGGSAALASAFSQVGAFPLAANSADSAVLQDLPVGAYTSEVSGVNGTTGVALAEIYDADTGSTSSSLVNISARANVGSGANILIAGFVVQGSQPVKMLLRGIGPTLGGAPYNVPGVLAQPEIDLFNSAGTKLSGNTGWGGDPALTAAFSAVGAFPLPAGSADSALLATLPAGSYTLQLSGQNGSTGVGLVEVYLMPQ